MKGIEKNTRKIILVRPKDKLRAYFSLQEKHLEILLNEAFITVFYNREFSTQTMRYRLTCASASKPRDITSWEPWDHTP
jgi:hypothetical protein